MADLDTLLLKTSRTFALAIPELPEPTRGEVRIAYLLFRIADTFEDATLWPPAQRGAALEAFGRLLTEKDPDIAAELARSWCERPPLDHEGYMELLAETPAVLAALHTLRPEAQATIRHHVQRTADGMARYARRKGDLRLETVAELRDYCYVVAGIVGEMLTALFLIDQPALRAVGPYLRTRARWFGEGLQLTNILKDSAGDAEEGRSFLPDPAQRSAVFGLAREDLRQAEEYVSALERAGAPRGVLAFNALPVLLAWETLDRVETQGPGAKLTRPEVLGLIQRMRQALEVGAPVMAPVDGEQS